MRLSFLLLNKQLCAIHCQRSLLSSLKNGQKSLSHFRYQSNESVRRLETPSTASSRLLNCDINILTKDGALQIHSGPFDRAEICQEYEVELRDLQKIDPELLINVPIRTVTAPVTKNW